MPIYMPIYTYVQTNHVVYINSHVYLFFCTMYIFMYCTSHKSLHLVMQVAHKFHMNILHTWLHGLLFDPTTKYRMAGKFDGNKIL